MLIIGSCANGCSRCVDEHPDIFTKDSRSRRVVVNQEAVLANREGADHAREACPYSAIWYDSTSRVATHPDLDAERYQAVVTSCATELPSPHQLAALVHDARIGAVSASQHSIQRATGVPNIDGMISPWTTVSADVIRPSALSRTLPIIDDEDYEDDFEDETDNDEEVQPEVVIKEPEVVIEYGPGESEFIKFYGNVKVEEFTCSDNRAIVIDCPRPIPFVLSSTGEVYNVSDIQILAIEGNEKPYIIVPEGKNVFRHHNINTGTSIITLRQRGREVNLMKCQSICNPIHCEHLLKNPEIAVAELIINLEHPNPSDGYSGQSTYMEDHVRMFIPDRALKCRNCSSFLNAQAPALHLVYRLCPTCISGHIADSELVLETSGHYIKRVENLSYKHTYDVEDAKLSQLRPLSDYYPIINAADINQDLSTLNVPKVLQDLVVLGLGSAGSNIVDQLSRTTFIKSMVLIDFDHVERKNLRNQTYVRQDFGNHKVFAMRDFLDRVERNKVKAFPKKFQDVNFQFMKAKYIVLGFDTIETRLEALEKIKTKEIEAQYIVDVRYDDLEAGIYFVDVSNEAEMTYYEQGLRADEAFFSEVPAEVHDVSKFIPCTPEQFAHHFKKEHMFTNACGHLNRKLFHHTPSGGTDVGNLCGSLKLRCDTSKCHEYGAKVVNDGKILIPGLTDNPEYTIDYIEHIYTKVNGSCTATKLALKIPTASTGCLCNGGSCGGSKCLHAFLRTAQMTARGEDGSSEQGCVKKDIIDAYKFSSTFVTAAIREVERRRDKPFTHVEVSTSGFPAIMKIR